MNQKLVRTMCLAVTAAFCPISAHAQTDFKTIEFGDFPAEWAGNTSDCDTDPEFHVHAYTEDFYILRQSRCISIQKPFLYLIFGDERAILFDTGAVGDPPDAQSDVAEIVIGLVEDRKKSHGLDSYELIVAHTHSHADHVGGDRYFGNLPDTTLLRLGVGAVSDFFGITDWPQQIVSYDLGNRVLDIVPIPGHDASAIAIYDRRTAVLLSGDSLLPGNLYTDGGYKAFRASTERMVDFTANRPIAHILGAHIDFGTQPYRYTPRGGPEHEVQLGRAHLIELQHALEAMDGKIRPIRLRDFRICGSFFTGC